MSRNKNIFIQAGPLVIEVACRRVPTLWLSGEGRIGVPRVAAGTRTVGKLLGGKAGVLESTLQMANALKLTGHVWRPGAAVGAASGSGGGVQAPPPTSVQLVFQFALGSICSHKRVSPSVKASVIMSFYLVQSKNCHISTRTS